MADYVEPNPRVDEAIAQIGAVVIVDRTYQVAKTEQGKVYGGAWTGPRFALTHSASDTAPAGFVFVSGDIGRAVATASLRQRKEVQCPSSACPSAKESLRSTAAP